MPACQIVDPVKECVDAYMRDKIQRGGAAQGTSIKDAITNQFDAVTYEQVGLYPGVLVCIRFGNALFF